MFAPIFLATAVLSLAVIVFALAKGVAAASLLGRELAHCSDFRTATVRVKRDSRTSPFIAARQPRRTGRQAAPLPLPLRQRVAA